MSTAEGSRVDIKAYHQMIATEIQNNRNKIDLLLQEPFFRRKHKDLARRAVSVARVHPTIPDYAVIDFVNQPGMIDPEAETNAAEIAKYLLELSLEYPPSGTASEQLEKYFQRQSKKPNGISSEEKLYQKLGLDSPVLHGKKIDNISKITHVVGIGNSGLSFANAVGSQFGNVQLVNVQKMEIGEEANIKNWDSIIKAKSYSKDVDRYFDFPLDQIPEGSTVLLADDVCANGMVSIQFAQFLLKHGINVAGLVVYFDKKHQGGLELFEAVCGVPAVSVLNIKKINSKKGTIEIAPFRQGRYNDGVRRRNIYKSPFSTTDANYRVGNLHNFNK